MQAGKSSELSAFALIANGMCKLKVFRAIRPAFRFWNDVIKGRALLGPQGGVSDYKPVAGHGFITQRANARLRIP